MEISSISVAIIAVAAAMVVVSICIVYFFCCGFLHWCGKMMNKGNDPYLLPEAEPEPPEPDYVKPDEELGKIIGSKHDIITAPDLGAYENNDTSWTRGSESLLRAHRTTPDSSHNDHTPALDSGNCSSEYHSSSRPSSGEIKASTSSSHGSSTTSGTRHTDASGGSHTTQGELLEPTSLPFWAEDICSRGLPILTLTDIENMIGGPIDEAQTDLKGGFGRVYKCYHSLHGHVAVKIMKGITQNEEEAATVTKSFKDEILALSGMRHDAIVAVKAMCLSPMAIVLEWMEGGSLQVAIEAKSLTEPKSVLAILKDVAKGLEYIHSMGMVHRDIKPHNILLSPDRNTAKIADFGLAKIAKPKADEKLASAHFSTGPAMGTEAYTDPAYKKSAKSSRHHDVYSFGLTIMMCLADDGSDVSTLKEKLLACDQRDPNTLRGMLHKNFRGTRRVCTVAVKLLHLARQCIDPHVHRRPVTSTQGVENPGALFLPSQLTQLLHELTTEDSVYDASGLDTKLLAEMPEKHKQALTQQLQRHWELVENCRRCDLNGVHDRFGNVVGFDEKGKPKDHYEYYGSTIVYAVECGVLLLAVDIKEHVNCNYKGNAVKHRLCVYLDRGMSVLDSTRALKNDKALFREREKDRKFYEAQVAKLSKYSEETRKTMEAKLKEQQKQEAIRAHKIPIEDVLAMVNHHRKLVRDLLKEEEKGQWELNKKQRPMLTNFSATIQLVEKLRQPEGKQPAKLRPDFITDERISELKTIRTRGNEAKHNMNSMNEEEGKQVDKLSEVGLMSASKAASR